MITRSLPINVSAESISFLNHDPSSLLFFDIETTGFSPKQASLYLIGVIFRQDNSWQLRQWLAEDDTEEPMLLNAFLNFAASYLCLIHFNGNRFDLPFIKSKCKDYEIEFLPNTQHSIDLYIKLKPLKKYLKLEHMTQKSLENFLCLERDDPFSGGELIPVYRDFSKNHDSELLECLLLHNHDDLNGMLKILPLLSYLDLISGKMTVSKVEITENDENSFYLLAFCTLAEKLPKTISLKLLNGYFTAGEDLCKIQIHGLFGTMKYFFKDYKNYYYLPEEDSAIHKSVAGYIDKEYRIPAKASTCYQRKVGYFLPQKNEYFSPSFKKSFTDPISYFECTNDFLENQDLLLIYLQHQLELQ